MTYKLSRELWVRPRPEGVELYSPVDPERPDQKDPYAPSQVLGDAEMAALVDWWIGQRGDKDNLIDLVVELVYDRHITCQAACAVLRVLVHCRVSQALAGWVMPEENER
jgi:hypothetical protein